MTKLHATTKNAFGDRHHFFASSAAEWCVSYDAASLIAKMKRAGFQFNLWLVPGGTDAEYEIEDYKPLVEGRVWLGAYLKKKR